MAHAVDIIRPKCRQCNRYSTKNVFNRYNASVGTYCSMHAKYKLRELEKAEKEYDKRAIINEVHEL